jgi:hypothetical protein
MSEDQAQPAEKKIIIDEDWKSQVQVEKERSASPDRAKDPPHRPPLPPASIAFLFSTLATQAFVALGLLPNPVTEKAETDHDQAKHFIDMLGVLEEKTRGNLSPDEKKHLDALLFDLRMQFVEVCKK